MIEIDPKQVTPTFKEAIEALGKQTYWNCTESNFASAGIAHRLGYQVKKAYRFWGWEQQGH
ncbi:MAG: hypothetical protein KDE58_27225 [Caldilineaceae bacterium]|nr:hypothetical protein [Caldilineaceae bacterium]